jgi:predicted MFS family arabinose efflux permease
LAFLVSALGRIPIRHIEIVSPRGPAEETIADRIRIGLGYVWRNPLVLRVVGGSALRNFGMAVVDTTLLLFAYRALHLSSAEGGLVLAAGALGGVTGALASSRLVRRLEIRRTLVCTGLEGATWLIVPVCLVVTPLPLIIALRMFTSMWLPIWNATTTSLRQTVTPAGQQSAVQSTARTLMASTVPLGSLVGGLASTGLTGLLGTSAGLAVTLAAGGACASLSVLVMRPATRDLSWQRLSELARR